jgi:fucose 4-O-acetylase-like acetyltransferase
MVQKNSMANKLNNIDWVDTLKGIGIVLVVIGHIYSGFISKFIFLFHMPLFFFISGFLFKKKESQMSYFKSKVWQLLVPYSIYLIIFYLAFTDFPNTQSELIKYIVKPIFGGRALINETGVFWFVTCLFFTQQIAQYLISNFSENKINIVIISSLIIAYLDSYFFSQYVIPLAFDVVFAALPFFYLGYIIRQKKYFPPLLLLILISTVSVFLLFLYEDFRVNMKYVDYGIPIISLLGGLSIIFLIILIAKKISQYKTVRNFINLLGKASLTIMFLHQTIQILVYDYLTHSRSFRVFIAILVSVLFHYLFLKTPLTRKLFLGYKK